jgi:hypothetical protein
MLNKYPIYIVSKGRWGNPLTAKVFIKYNVPFKILVEPQEYEKYCKVVGPANVIQLPFANLGLGSYPARNYAWEHSIKNGFARHWVFDDNIRDFRILIKGKRLKYNALKAIIKLEEFTEKYLNIGITAFDYTSFVIPSTNKKAFHLNTHCYSAMLIKNDVPYRWRLKYNEDVDLCLQFLNDKYCTVLTRALMVTKVSTTSKMKGGNQTELYKGNAREKKILKARSLEMVWPEYAKTVIRFNRPHHFVNWVKYFKHPLKKKA